LALEAATLGTTIMLTVVLRQKRRFVMPVTPKTPDQSYVSVGGWVDDAEIHDVGQKGHHRFGAACNRNDCRNDWCFCQRTWWCLHRM